MQNYDMIGYLFSMCGTILVYILILGSHTVYNEMGARNFLYLAL